MKLPKIVKACRIDQPGHFRLADHDPAQTFGLQIDKDDLKAMLAADVARIEKLQQRLYAQDRWAVLIVLQGMDAAGKDGVVKHVMSGVNPQGCAVHSFKAPTAEELRHDFLWRAARRLPPSGQIGIFNRSYYEEVLVVRVHPEMLAHERLPHDFAGKSLWKHRFKEINAFERHLTRNGTLILKFHLRISKEEQRQRFLARLDEPAKRWKFSMNDVLERRHWDAYMTGYEDMIRETSTEHAPWYVIPADHKQIAWLAVSAAINEAVEKLAPEPPKITGEKLKELKAAEKALRAEAPGKPSARRKVLCRFAAMRPRRFTPGVGRIKVKHGTVGVHTIVTKAAACFLAATLAAAFVVGHAAAAPADFDGVWIPDIKDQKRQETQNMPSWKPNVAPQIQHMIAEEKAGRPFLVLGHCLPHGMPSWMLITHNAFEWLTTSGRVTFLGEVDGNRMRRIYTDGRTHPDDADPTMHGHSIGHWDGDVFVVDTVAVVPQAYIAISEATGVPNNGDMHIVERFYRPKPNVLNDDLEITAPKVLTDTWKTTRLFRRYPERHYEIVEGECVEEGLVPGKDEFGNDIFVPYVQKSPDGSVRPIK